MYLLKVTPVAVGLVATGLDQPRYGTRSVRLGDRDAGLALDPGGDDGAVAPLALLQILKAEERDRDALLENYAEMMPEALDVLQPEERHRVYKMLRLRAVAFPDGSLEVSGALGEELFVCKDPTRWSRSRGT